MVDEKLTNREIHFLFKKYLKLKSHPLGMYFSEQSPSGRKRKQYRLYNRCIVKHVYKAARYGKSSIIQADKGCIGGQWWSGFRRRAPKGLAIFLANGRKGIFGNRAEHFKKNVKTAGGVFKEPGPVNIPMEKNYIIFQRLEEIPNNIKIEFILFFAKPKTIAKLITLCNYAHHKTNLVRAPGGSGCMSILNFPLQLAPKPEPDAVLGFWDLFARSSMPRNIFSLAVRHWYAEDMAKDIPNSFLGHKAPYTIMGELKLFIEKRKKSKD
ncbi:MAG: hypothetical protein EAX90_09860 [Candidatus Heimdallarchaeota archaeon]|nr:hypothetical protein [Candidatus Heimdallarchaeota archaeon]